MLGLDARIGEGFVHEARENCLVSKTHLRLARYGYYAGKTLSNEDGTTLYKLKDVEKGTDCLIDEGVHGKVDPELLSRQFCDRDGDGLTRFLIYDYGPGDEVVVKAGIAGVPHAMQ